MDELRWNTIAVYDLLGRQMLSVILNNSEGTKTINVEQLTSGVYFIKATDIQGNVSNAKFVKQ